MWIHGLTAGVLSLFAAQPAVELPQTSEGQAPGFEASPCPFEVRADDDAPIRCGYVTVPEDWDAPEGRSIRIAVAVLEARAEEGTADPIVWVHGGPMPRVHDAPWFAQSSLRDTRDVVLLDHRGIGHSDAICPDLGRGYVRALGLPHSTAESLDELRRLAGECRAWAHEHGVDLGAYRSRNMARDVLAIVEALGHDSWNLHIDSYGSFVAFSLMELQPEGLGAVSMGGLVPPDIERIETNAFARSVDLMVTHCERDPACGALFPDLRSEYEALHARLEEEPLALPVARTELFPDGTFHLGGRAFQRLVLQLLANRSGVGVLPMLIRETARGNTAPMASFVDQIAPFGAGISGTTWAAWCSELGAWAENFRVPDRPAADDHNYRVELASLCPALGVAPRPPEERQPVTSDLPVLLVVGELDPHTPPEYTHAAAAWLTNHHLFERPGLGHEFPACEIPVITAFFDDPTVRPEDACPDLSDVPFITNVRVTPGIARIAARALSGEVAPILVGLGLPLAVMLTGTVGWPASALVRKVRRRERRADAGVERWARLGAGAAGLLALLFVVLLGWMVAQAIGENPFILMIGVPSSAAPLFLLPWLLLAGSLALVVAAISGWKRGWWTRWGRIHFTLVATATAAFTAVVFAWGLI
jgi:pimeloyl-ACP methyl ester carboxylesterase